MGIRFNNSHEFINSLALLIEKTKDSRKRQQEDYYLNNMDTTFKKGKVDASYSSGRPRIIFEGEDTASLKAYPYLSSYAPAANDIVLLARVGNSYVVLGKIQ